jgi:tripartite-type tricarboxylate transporter receptor subunit TctC
MKRLLNILISAVAAVAMTGSAMAADFPSKTIHLVVPWKAGGGTDNIGRGIAKALEEVSGQSVVVDNISGAGGIKGSLAVANGATDGYTVLMNGTTDLTAAMTFQDVPVKLDDYKYVGGFYTSPTWIVAHKDRGYENFEQVLEKAKANPGTVTIGTGGPAGAQMLMASAIKGISGADFRIIPYSGGADLKKAIIGNQVDAGILHAPVMLPEAKEGMIKVIGTGLPLDGITYEPLRNVKTMKQIDIPVEVGITRGMFVAKGTPDDVVEKLRELAEKAAMSETFKQFGDKYGFAPVWIPGPEFEKQIRKELAEFKEIHAKYIKK